MKTIHEIIDYKDENIIKIIMQKLKVSKSIAENKLKDTLKYLYLCATSKRFLAPPINIDEVWHLFILSTETYAEFCIEYLGKFIHHRPAVDGIVPGINVDLEILHLNTLSEIQKLNKLLGEPNMSINFASRTDVYNWCCHGLSNPDPDPNPESEPEEKNEIRVRCFLGM